MSGGNGNGSSRGKYDTYEVNRVTKTLSAPAARVRVKVTIKRGPSPDDYCDVLMAIEVDEHLVNMAMGVCGPDTRAKDVAEFGLERAIEDLKNGSL